MAIKILHKRPPIYSDIIVAFPKVATMQNVYYAWGDRIYNPDGAPLEPQIMAHESVHCERQKRYRADETVSGGYEESIRLWWTHYLIDPVFRYKEELVAHKAEYKFFCGICKDWRKREAQLTAIAMRLSGEMYGGLVTFLTARREIRG